MTLNLRQENRIYKKLFNLKIPQRNGLVLSLQHKTPSRKIRFINSCFDGNILVVADNEGNIFAIDFSTNKSWSLPKTTACAVMKFSNFGKYDILIGAHTGLIQVMNIQTGLVIAKLTGHEHPVINISYASPFLCLSASSCEAIIWDMQTNTKIQVLKLDHNCSLKQVTFVPVSGDILALFNDNFIQVWHTGTFEMKTQIPPVVWFNHDVRNVSFTLDGKVMMLGCRLPYLALFLLSNFKLLRFITLPEYIQTVKHIAFISQANDGGANKIVSVLSGRGTIYFYDTEQNIVISELVSTYEISKYDTYCNYVACVLSSGGVNVYDVTSYIVVPLKVKAIRADALGKSTKLNKCLQKMGFVKSQIRDILDIEKLRMILKECGEYPSSYRMKIWQHLLELPDNRDQYNAIINHRMIVSFEDLCHKYPLENKRCLKNLKQLLDNLVTWCPFFLHVDYLPVLVFPFVKVFPNKPLACFEAVCTVIVNWCQFWFEYFPLPPVNILAMIENIAMEHDPELLSFFTKNNISSKLYAWPILKTALSEILTATAWQTFWDHVLTNEPSFLLCAIVAYNILQRTTLFALKKETDFKCFYYTHHPIDVKKLLSKTYHILNETSDKIHPRQYLNMFKKIVPGEYPNFCAYPKTIVDLKTKKTNVLKKELDSLKTDEIDLFKTRLVRLDKFEELGIQQEENKRFMEMENEIKTQIMKEQEQVQNYQQRLALLRNKFREEDEILSSLQNKIYQKQQQTNRRLHQTSLLSDTKMTVAETDYSMNKIENELLYNYSELLKSKHKIENLLEREIVSSTKLDDKSPLYKQQQELSQEISNILQSPKSHERLKLLNLETGVEAMDALIQRIELELRKVDHGNTDESTADGRVLELQAETEELISEVNNLLHVLMDLKHTNSSG